MRAGGGAEGEAGARALQDLTGGVVQALSLARQPPARALQALSSAAPRATLLLAAPARAAPLPRAAAFVVAGLARARGAPLVRLRAVGGPAGAWRGSPALRALPPRDRALLDAHAQHPDEFW